MNTSVVNLFDGERVARRDRLKREVAFLKAIGAPTERLLRPLVPNARCERVNVTENAADSVVDPAVVRELAKPLREAMRPHLDEARRSLLAQARALTPQSPASQVQEAIELLEALRHFDVGGSQTEEIAEHLARIVHGTVTHRDGSGGSQRREV